MDSRYGVEGIFLYLAWALLVLISASMIGGFIWAFFFSRGYNQANDSKQSFYH